MEEKVIKAITEYQCSGCLGTNFNTCYSLNTNDGIGCGKHVAGTIIASIGKLFLGLPKGFNRLGHYNEMIPIIFEKYKEKSVASRKFNLPVWKHLNEEGHTLIRGLRPRLNEPYLHIYLEDCMDKFDCMEITVEDMKQMD